MLELKKRQAALEYRMQNDKMLYAARDEELKKMHEELERMQKEIVRLKNIKGYSDGRNDVNGGV